MGFLWAMGKGMAKGVAKSALPIGKSLWGVGGFGILGSRSIASRILVPGAMIAAGAAVVGGYGTINAPYSMHSNRAAWGYTPGAAGKSSSRGSTMGFRGYDTGGLAFALWNLRKG